jgi:hypothetical protein
MLRQCFGSFQKRKKALLARRVFRQSYTRNGQSFLAKAWTMKLAHEGRGETFPFGTPNKAVAAATAQDIYLFLAATLDENP